MAQRRDHSGSTSNKIPQMPQNACPLGPRGVSWNKYQIEHSPVQDSKLIIKSENHVQNLSEDDYQLQSWRDLSSRRTQLNQLDKNFEALMSQNYRIDNKVEHKIHSMNQMYDQRSHSRDLSSNLVSFKQNSSDVTAHVDGFGSQMNQSDDMMSDFEKKCQETKAKVAQLSLALSNIKQEMPQRQDVRCDPKREFSGVTSLLVSSDTTPRRNGSKNSNIGHHQGISQDSMQQIENNAFFMAGQMQFKDLKKQVKPQANSISSVYQNNQQTNVLNFKKLMNISESDSSTPNGRATMKNASEQFSMGLTSITSLPQPLQNEHITQLQMYERNSCSQAQLNFEKSPKPDRNSYSFPKTQNQVPSDQFENQEFQRLDNNYKECWDLLQHLKQNLPIQEARDSQEGSFQIKTLGETQNTQQTMNQTCDYSMPHPKSNQQHRIQSITGRNNKEFTQNIEIPPRNHILTERDDDSALNDDDSDSIDDLLSKQVESSSALMTAKQLALLNPRDLNLHGTNLHSFLKSIRTGKDETPQNQTQRQQFSEGYNNSNQNESELVSNGTAINLNHLIQIAQLAQLAQTPENSSIYCIKQTKKFKPFMTSSDQMCLDRQNSLQFSGLQSNREINSNEMIKQSYQVETAPTLKQQLQSRIIEEKQFQQHQFDQITDQSTSQRASTTSRHLKPEISQMHKDIMSLQEKIKQLEGSIADKQNPDIKKEEQPHKPMHHNFDPHQKSMFSAMSKSEVIMSTLNDKTDKFVEIQRQSSAQNFQDLASVSRQQSASDLYHQSSQQISVGEKADKNQGKVISLIMANTQQATKHEQIQDQAEELVNDGYLVTSDSETSVKPVEVIKDVSISSNTIKKRQSFPLRTRKQNSRQGSNETKNVQEYLYEASNQTKPVVEVISQSMFNPVSIVTSVAQTKSNSNKNGKNDSLIRKSISEFQQEMCIVAQQELPSLQDYSESRPYSPNAGAQDKKSLTHNSSRSKEAKKKVAFQTDPNMRLSRQLHKNLNVDLPLSKAEKSVSKINLSDCSMQLTTSNTELRSATENKDQNLNSEASKNQISLLEQRNKHLEIELRRLQEVANKNGKVADKYKELKDEYKELLQTFEKSEQIRHEQKEMISDQRQQAKALKGKVKLQDEQIQEMHSKQRYLEVIAENAQRELKQIQNLQKSADPDCSTSYMMQHSELPHYKSMLNNTQTQSNTQMNSLRHIQMNSTRKKKSKNLNHTTASSRKSRSNSRTSRHKRKKPQVSDWADDQKSKHSIINIQTQSSRSKSKKKRKSRKALRSRSINKSELQGSRIINGRVEEQQQDNESGCVAKNRKKEVFY